MGRSRIDNIYLAFNEILKRVRGVSPRREK